MKNVITYLKTLWGAWGNLLSNDVICDRRLTRGVLCFLGKLARRIYSFGCSQDILGAPQSLHSSQSGLNAKTEQKGKMEQKEKMSTSCLLLNSYLPLTCPLFASLSLVSRQSDLDTYAAGKTNNASGARVAREWMKYAAVLLLLLTLGVGNVWGEDWTWTPTSTSSISGTSSNVTLNSKSWTVTRSKANYIGFVDEAGIQFGSRGSGAETVTFTSSAFTGTISSIVVVCSSYNQSHTLTVKVNNTNYTLTGNIGSGQTPASVTATGSSSGTIEIKLTAGSRACYIKSISITTAAATFSVTVKSPTGRGAYTDVSVTDKTKMFASGGVAFSQVVAKHKACTWSDSYMEAWNNAYVDYEISKADKVSTKPTSSGTKHIYTTEAGLPSSGTLYPLFIYGGYYYTEATCPTLFVNYDSNGATSGTAPSDGNNYDPGDDVIVLGQGTLTRTNYTFTGWNTESDGSGTHYDENDHFDMPDEDVYLYAEWCKDLSKSSITVNEPTLTSYNSGTGKWTVNVTWTAVDGATYYTVQCGDRATSTVVLSETNVGNVTSYSISNLTNAHEHRIIVTAKHACDATQKQGKVDFTPTCDKDVSAITPTVNATTSITKTSATANWAAVSDADHYTVKVYQGTTVAGDPVKTYNDVAGTSQVITGLTAGTQYCVTVQAHDACSHDSQIGTGGVFTTTALTLYHVDFVNQSGAAVATVTQTTEGGNVTLPSASPSAACAALGWSFAGWKDGSAQTETTSAPTLIAAGSYTPSGNKTFYAVYTKTESGGGTPKTTLLSSDFSSGNDNTNWPTQENITPETGSIRFSSKSGAGSIESISLSASVGTTINVSLSIKDYGDTDTEAKVSITGCSEQSFATSSYEDFTEVTKSFVSTQANFQVTIAASGTKKRFYIENVEVYYGGGGSSTTYWNSNPSCSSEATVTYHNNGAKSGSAPTDGTTYTVGDQVTVLGTGTMVAPDGKEFKCWNTAADGTGTDYNIGAKFDIAGNMDFYPKWVNAPYTVTFNAEGGTCGTASLTEASGGAGVTLPEAIATCSDWSFAGWKESSGQSETTSDISSSLYEAGTTYYPTSNITLHAVFATYGSGSNTTFAVVKQGMTAVQDGYYVISYNRAATLYSLGSSSYVINPSTGRSGVTIIEVPSTSMASEATLSSKDPVWQFIHVSSNNYRIRNYKTGQYLKATDENNELLLSSTADDNYSLWTITCVTEDNNANTNKIQNVATSDYLIKYTSGDCYVSQGSTPQTLYFYRVTSAPIFGSATYNSNPSCPTHEVTIGSHTNGTIEVNGLTTSPQTVEDGNTVEITATPESGYNFTTWTITKTTGGNDVTSTLLGANATTASTSFTMPDYDVTVSATFTAKVMCTITWNVNGSTYTTGGPSTSAESGSKWSALTLPTAPADNTLSGCERTKFVGWSTSQLFGDGNSAPSDLFKSTSDDNADSHTITGTTTFYAVFAKGSGDGWEKVSSAPDNWCGDYLLAYEASASSVFVWNGSTDASNYVEATPSDGLISKPTGGVEITIEHFGETANYAIKVKEGTNKDKYFKGNSSNGFTLEDTQQNTTIGSVEDIGFTFTNSSSYLRFNTTSGQTRFRYYKSSTAQQSSYKTIALYQQASNYSDYATQCCTLKPVTNLAVSSTTANSVTLTWTAPSPTTGIDHLELRNASTDVKIGSNIAVGTTTTSVSELTECNTYSYKIVSVGAVCETPSDVVEATPFSGSKTVTFNYHEGTGSPASFTTSCSAASTTLPTPTRDGYTFLGWWTAADGGSKVGDAGANYDVATTTTIHAHWAQNFSVTYDRVGGTNVCADETCGAGMTYTVCGTEPTKSGYIFSGWLSNEATPQTYAAGATFTMPAANVTLTAQWTANWHNLTFNVPTGGGGSITGGPAGNHVLDNHTFTFPNITGKSDSKWCWTFLGWTETAPNGSGRWDVTPSYIAGGATSGAITSDKTYYAVYSKTGAGASGTAELTCTDMYNWITTTLSGTANNYGTTTTYTAADGFTWQTNGQVTTVSQGAHLVIRGRTNSNGVSWIKLPTFGGNIREIRLEVSQGNSNTSCSNLGNNTENGIGLQAGTSNSESVIASSEHTSSKSRTITVTGSHTTGYLTIDYSASTSGATNIISIEVDYGPAAIYGYTLDDCPCVVEEFDLTYDANTTNFPGSTITPCTGVTDYRWEDHDDEYTICSTEPTCDGYKFTHWATNANGSGTTYNAGEVISCVGETPITLYAQYERVYTVTFDNQGVQTPVKQASEGATIAVPSATSPCSAEWAFVGWSETAIAPMSLLPTLEIEAGTSTYTPTADKTLYAIYRKTSTSSAFVAGMSGAYKIKATYNATDYYAQACNNSKLPATTTAGDGTVFYISYTSADGGKYTIQQTNGKYVKYAGSSTTLELSDDAFYWTFTANDGLWSVFAVGSGDRYLRYSHDTGFKAYNTNSSANYLAFIAADGQYHYRTMSCEDDFDITFHNNGTTINWAAGHTEASYKDLADATIVSTFPTASFDGWTFLGWRTADYTESTDAPASSGIYGGSNGTSGNALTIASANVDLYPVFTKFDDNDPFDQINGGDYYIYFLESGSNDGYGAEKRVYAKDYVDQKRYLSTALCDEATGFTFTKLENGKWTIKDTKTNKYLYATNSDEDKLLQSTTPYEWTITVRNGNQFNAICDGQTYGQLIANGNGTSATFMSYRITNIENNPGVYHPVYLGSCTNRTFTTNPSTTPNIELHGQVKVTSTAGKGIKAASVLTVSASNIATANLSVTSNNSAFKFSLTSNGMYTASVNIPVVSNKVGVTPVYVEYTPSATTDGIEEAIVTVSDGDVTPTTVSTAAGDVQGRHVPANFVIAAKAGNEWVALTAKISKMSTQDAIPIKVDNTTTPTKASVALNTCEYSLLGLPNTNSRYATNGTAVHLLSSQTSKVLNATKNISAKTYLNTGATATNAASSDSCLFYEWKLVSSDLVHYTVTNSNELSGLASNRILGYSTASGKWGMYASGSGTNQDIFLLPIETVITDMEAEVMEWGTTSMVLRIAGTAPSNVNITLGGTPSGSKALTAIAAGSDLYKVEGLTLTGNNCEVMMIADAADASKGTLVRKPILVSGEATGSTYTSAPGRDVCANCDIVILNGGKLTADENKASGDHVDFANIYVYPGGKLVLDAKSLGVKQQVYVRGGYSWLNTGTYALPELYLNGNINFNGSGKIIYDYYIQNYKYYQFALPYTVPLAKVTDEAGVDNFPVWVKHYNGALRAANAQATSWEWYEGENFEAGIGYIIAARPRQVDKVQNRPLSIIRFPLTNNAYNGSGEAEKSVSTTAHGITGYGAGTVTANNVGWNFVGNPYMATWKGDIGHQQLEKDPDAEHWNGSYHWADGTTKYITVMSPEDGTDYDQYVASTTELKPFFPFYFQETAEGGNGTLIFTLGNRIKKAPAAVSADAPREAFVQIDMMDGTSQDQTGVYVGDKYSDELDFDDMQKMFGSLTTKPKVWIMHDETRMAFEAMSEERAASNVPVGYRAPVDGEFTFTLSNYSELDNVESVLLNDNELGVYNYNLLNSDYEFESGTVLYNDTRFTLRIVLKDENTGTPTGTETINLNSEEPLKFIYEDKMYILRGGVIYDATGKKVGEINK